MDEFKNNEHIDAEDTQESAFQTSLEENTEEEIVVTEKKSVKKELLDWIISIVVALAIAFFVREYVFTIVRVDGPSMQPTLEDSDILFVNRFMYEPENGEALFNLGNAYSKSGDTASAITVYKQVIELFPDTDKARKAKNYIEEIQGL